MSEILAIARNTFKEAVRNRILYVILIFALILIGFSGMLSQLTISSPDKIVKDLGFAAINLFGVAIAVFVGVSLVYNELEKKTIYTIVSKPIHRWQFLLGKYFGLLMTVLVNVLVMTLFFLIVIHYHALQVEEAHSFLATLGRSIGRAFVNFFAWEQFEATRHIMVVIAMTCLEMAIITAFAILYSSFTTPTLSMFFTVLTFIAGRLNEDIVRFADQVWMNAYKAAQFAAGPLDLPFSYYFAMAAAHVVPNLGFYHRTVDQAIYSETIEVWWVGSVLYGFVYTAAVLALSVAIFHRRNFK